MSDQRLTTPPHMCGRHPAAVEPVTDLLGKVCPFAVVNVVHAVQRMSVGSEMVFLIDDPLALKSIPEELEEFGDLTWEAVESGSHWRIVVRRG